jgi:hypothetical protein
MHGTHYIKISYLYFPAFVLQEWYHKCPREQLILVRHAVYNDISSLPSNNIVATWGETEHINKNRLLKDWFLFVEVDQFYIMRAGDAVLYETT